MISAIRRQRLPCVALALAAVGGILLGRLSPVPAWTWAACAALSLLAGLRVLPLLWPGAALAFAALQGWEGRESPAARLAAELGGEWAICEAALSVSREPAESGNGVRFTAWLENLRIAGRDSIADCRVTVNWQARTPPQYGSRYRVRAAIRNVPPPRNPGELDAASWLANEGIRSELLVASDADAQLLATGGNPIVRFSIAARQWIERTLSLGITGTEEASLQLAMTVGDTANVSDALRDDFRRTGTYHLFSVSGLHVGIVAVILWFVFGSAGLDRRHVVLLIIPSLFFYSLITGLQPASLRTATMLSIVAAGLIVDRWPVALNSLGASALAIFLADTNQLFNPGFQLSYCVVAAILLFAMPVNAGLAPMFDPDPFLPTRLISPIERGARETGKWFVALFSVSFAASIGSFPLVLAYFHLVSLVSIPANLLAVPLAFLALALASLSLLSAVISPWIAAIFNNAAYAVVHVMLALVNGFAHVPWGSWYVAPPPPPGTLATITILDAGRGSANLVTAGGKPWLIDTGSESFAGRVVVPLLRERGVNALEGVVLTHGDSTHIGGFDRIREALPIGEVLDSGLKNRSPIQARIRSSVANLTPALSGLDRRIDAGASLRILYPPASTAGRLADDKAVVLRIDAGKFSALFLSDSGPETAQWLLAHARDQLPCDVAVIGRHSSGQPVPVELLAAAAPRVLIASFAAFPPAEGFRASWLEAVSHAGIILYRQDETGAVAITIRSRDFTISPFLSTVGSRTFSNDPIR